MGKAKRPKQVKLLIGMLAKNKALFDTVEEFFIKMFGKIDYKSPVLPFAHTDYYTKEMGAPLERQFVSFRKLIHPEHLPKIKIATNSLEERLSKKEKDSRGREINIDPGYISDSKLVLATTKNYSHRIYMNKGVYAEVTLTWKKSGFKPLDWTYPDYKTEEYINILNSIRNTYMKEWN